MKVSEAIKILESKVVKSEENLKHFPKESQGYAANEARIIAYNIAINTLEQIDEPRVDKVVVPDYVAEWYETNKASIERAVSMQIQHGFTPLVEPRSKFDMWFFDESNHPIETLIRMKDGYTVKPKRWVVKNKKHGSGLESFINGTVKPMWTTEEPLWMTFTDKSKAEAVATLVEGSVEEV